MNENLSIEDYVLLLLNANNEKEIKGNLFIQKEVFLIVKEISPELEDKLKFKPYNYGPYSFILTDTLEKMRDNGVIHIKEDENSNIYSITPEGNKLIDNKNIDSNLKNRINKLKKGSFKLGYKGLLRYVYFNYPEYTTKSEIKEEVLGE